MISTSTAYKAAITGDARRMRVRVIVDLSDPDMTGLNVSAPPLEPWSNVEQLFDKKVDLFPPLITLEPNRWILDESYIPVGEQDAGSQVGAVTQALSDRDGYFSTPQVFAVGFSGARIIQQVSAYFSALPEDGVPSDVLVEILSGTVLLYSQRFTGNTERYIKTDYFTVNYPTTVRFTITRWSLPSRKIRAAEMIPSAYEIWTEDDLAELSVTMESSFTGLSLPYSTCTLKMDNLDRRFDPRNPHGIFQSVQERQGIQVFIGPDIPGGVEYIPLGTYYQSTNGWTESDNDITMRWTLLDIVGLMKEREFMLPDVLPTTLDGWVKALAGQLGTNFEKRVRVDPGYAGRSVTANDRSLVFGKNCGQVLLWLCEATQTWPRADAETGYLCLEPLWNEGIELKLDNLTRYPNMKANNELALLNFTLNGSGDNVVSIGGTNLSATQTANISNPFLHTEQQARLTARMMLQSYGGTQLETTGRGDPSSEIGDVATVWLDESNATTGRVMFQSFAFRDGVLRDCKTRMLQGDGALKYQNRVFITRDQTWTAPYNTTALLVLGQGGKGGTHGKPGKMGGGYQYVFGGSTVPSEDGDPGEDGYGGKVWFGTVTITAGTEVRFHIGNGGGAGAEGGHSTATLGGVTFTSASGNVFPNGYTDIITGSSFGRTGVEAPLPNSSDGGKGGAGGNGGWKHWEGEIGDHGVIWGRDVIDVEPGAGEPGAHGASGFGLIYYDKETET